MRVASQTGCVRFQRGLPGSSRADRGEARRPTELSARSDLAARRRDVDAKVPRRVARRLRGGPEDFARTPRGRTRGGRARAGDEDATRAMTLLGTPRCSKTAARGRAEGAKGARRSRFEVGAKAVWVLALAAFGSRGADAMEEGRIALGGDHTCAIADDGEVRCWGRNAYGQLGLGDTTQRTSPAGPVNFGSGRKAKYIAASYEHTCAILADDDSLMCWGSNIDSDVGVASGQLGLGSSEMTYVTSPQGPIDLGADRFAKSIALGPFHTCALLDDGSVKCWGNNQYGRLGVGDTANLYSPGAAVNFGSGRKAQYIAAGYHHTCAILEDYGSLMCWGRNTAGQLGIGSAGSYFDSPRGPVDLGLDRKAVGIALGSGHTCAILDNGGVRCWGSDHQGQLGYATVTEALDLGYGVAAEAISSFSLDTCALLDDASVRCWGSNGNGQHGVGDTVQRTGVAPAVNFTDNLNATSVASGMSHTCASLSDGSLWCWGLNQAGQLGYGVNTHGLSRALIPVLVPNVTVTIPVPSLPAPPPPVNATFTPTPSTATTTMSRTVSVVASVKHTCAIVGDGKMKCWGDNRFGQLGVNKSYVSQINSPREVNLADRTVTSIALGYQHTCAVLSDESLWCWGDNQHGQVGDGTTGGERVTPTAVASLGPGTTSSVACGDIFSCAILKDGSVKCWGGNSDGELGTGAAPSGWPLPNSSVPVAVDIGTGRTAVSLSSGKTHTCVIVDDGSVKCWGWNAYGSIGTGSALEHETSPVEVASLGGVASNISAGGYSTCAILVDGDVMCWGRNNKGQLGIVAIDTFTHNDTVDKQVPTYSHGLSTRATQISMGSKDGACAVLIDGHADCWGSRELGQQGEGTRRKLLYAYKVAYPTDTEPVSISSGGGHACLTTIDDAIWCWGNNDNGQVGRDDQLNPFYPIQVTCGRNQRAEAGACLDCPEGFIRAAGDPIGGSGTPGACELPPPPPPPMPFSPPPTAVADPPETPSSPGPADDPRGNPPGNATASPPPALASVAEPPPPPRVLVADEESGARSSNRRGGGVRWAIFTAVFGAAASMATVGAVASNDERVSRRGCGR